LLKKPRKAIKSHLVLQMPGVTEENDRISNYPEIHYRHQENPSYYPEITEEE
jgi:hypothetical protein